MFGRGLAPYFAKWVSPTSGGRTRLVSSDYRRTSLALTATNLHMSSASVVLSMGRGFRSEPRFTSGRTSFSPRGYPSSVPAEHPVSSSAGTFRPEESGRWSTSSRIYPMCKSTPSGGQHVSQCIDARRCTSTWTSRSNSLCSLRWIRLSGRFQLDRLLNTSLPRLLNQTKNTPWSPRMTSSQCALLPLARIRHTLLVRLSQKTWTLV